MSKFECQGCLIKHRFEGKLEPRHCLYEGGITNWREIKESDRPDRSDGSDLSDEKRLPKLTVDMFDHPDCPDWVFALTVNQDGSVFGWEKRPCIWEISTPTAHWSANAGKESKFVKLPVVCDPRNWRNSLIERSPKLSDWCQPGKWVWHEQNGFGRVVEIIQEARGPMPKVEFQSGCGPQRDSELKPARVRPWTFEEAPEYIKIRIQKGYEKCFIFDRDNPRQRCISLERPSYGGYGWYDAELQGSLSAHWEQLDGSPCGVLEVIE